MVKTLYALSFLQTLNSDSSFRIPFDWQNPLGYLIAVAFQYTGAVCCSIFIFSASFLGIGCYLFLKAIITKVITNDLKLINENAAASNTKRFLTLNLFADFIQTYSTLKKLSVLKIHTIVTLSS